MITTVVELLAAADAQEYAVHFRREGFRLVREVLDAGLTQRDLDEMGVTNAEARNRIIRVLFRSNSAAGAEGEQAPEDDTLSLWLSELGVKQLCAPRFRAEGFFSLQEVIDARLSEDDLKDLGLETMKARKAALKSLNALTSEATAKQGSAGLGAAAEATFIESYHRHRRLSAGSLASPSRDSSFESAVGMSDSGSDGEFAASDDDGGDSSPVDRKVREAQEGLIRAIGVLPAGDLQAPLLHPPNSGMQLEDDEETEKHQSGESSDMIGLSPNKVRLAVVGLFALGVSVAFIVMWLASYNFDLEELIQREVEGYRVGDSSFDLAALLLFACTSLLVGASLGCSSSANGGYREASARACAAAVLVLPALAIGTVRVAVYVHPCELVCDRGSHVLISLFVWYISCPIESSIWGAATAAVRLAFVALTGSVTKLVILLIRVGGSGGEEMDRVWLRLGTLTLVVAFLPTACAGIRWSRLLQTGTARQLTLIGLLRLGLGVSEQLLYIVPLRARCGPIRFVWFYGCL